MIRSSKRSLSRDLVRFLHYIDDCAVRRYGFVVGSQFKFRGCDGKKPQAVGVAEERIMEKLRNRMGKVLVSNGELEELDSMSDESEELPMKSSYKFARGNVVKAKPMVSGKDRNVYERIRALQSE